ncbi:DUF2953 domain-containing protein [Pullulanibacillus sp. KACC 23026]|uniref:DUF2953 domain-containing protein n=1 Tax=Pullulanibacillus sp. KACC 23026 TaxID=3028315 RepID=UPI0023AF58B7|nr:DUF2953 domain-containing protein [Pullulanibacillus sp. KACC 23026]WEG13881.1 DUF2953 domain-containing protein [Pullulanibacillus sp. KACC 23026]
MLWLKWVVGILLVLLVVMIILNFLLIKIKLKADVEDLDGHLEGFVYIWKWKVFHFSIPDVHIDEDPIELTIQNKTSITEEQEKTLNKDQLTHLYSNFKSILDIMGKRKKKSPLLKIKDFNWETSVGCHQADQTAIAIGVCWALKSTLLGVVQSFMYLESPYYNILPLFNEWHFETHLSCMISFRLGKAIRQAIWIRKQFKRRQLLHGGTSYSRTHEDSA